MVALALCSGMCERRPQCCSRCYDQRAAQKENAPECAALGRFASLFGFCSRKGCESAQTSEGQWLGVLLQHGKRMSSCIQKIAVHSGKSQISNLEIVREPFAQHEDLEILHATNQELFQRAEGNRDIRCPDL